MILFLLHGLYVSFNPPPPPPAPTCNCPKYKSCRWDQFEDIEVINLDFNCIAVIAIFSASKNTSMTMIGG
jgi:hypothetical protein